MVNLKLKSLKSSGTFDYVDAPDTNDSSPEGMIINQTWGYFCIEMLS